MAQRARVLFFAEAVTLCHVARPLVLASALDRARYEVHFACHPRYHPLLVDCGFTLYELGSISSQDFLRRLSRGSPAYHASELRAYVEEDLQRIDQVRPQLIVGDFRLSLAVSARLRKIPYATITNAYWSPFAEQPYVVPQLPLTRIVPPGWADPFFQLIRPLAFAHHCRALNRVRREFGLPSLGHDLRTIYTDAEHTLYADAPELVPIRNLPAHHRYMGPILWSFPVPLPDWWDDVPRERPTVFVSLGSSGPVGLLPELLAGLRRLNVNVMIATSQRMPLADLPEEVFAADYLPAGQASARADLTICHGGSASAYVAVAAGRPVLGIPSILDQHLTIRYLERVGVGRALRSEEVTAAKVASRTAELLETPAFRRTAENLAAELGRYDAAANFRDFVKSCLSSGELAASASRTDT